MSRETLHLVSVRDLPMDPTDGFILQITTSQGGVGLHLKKGEPVEDVIEHLRQLSDRLEKDVIERGKGQTK